MKNRELLLVAMMAGVGAISATAHALPAIGSVAPSTLKVVDGYDRSLDLKSLANKPILVIYEDKDSATVNQALKDELSKLAKGDKYKRAIALVPVADVSGYDYWPARGFVKSAIRDESKKAGATIYCDWSGSFRRALGLRGGTSSVVLINRDGKVVFARDGVVDAADRKRLLDMLRAEVGG